MAVKNKGAEHRQQILFNARHALYENGYQNMSLRELAALSNDNVAIFKYYFGSKYQMVFTIYADLLNLMDQQVSGLMELSPKDEFILFNLLELKLCLENPALERLYYELSQEAAFTNSLQNNFVGHIQKHYPEYSPEHTILLALSIVHIKSAIVTYDIDRTAFTMNMYVDISHGTFMNYYLDQLLNTLEKNVGRHDYFLSLLDRLTLVMGEDFSLKVRLSETK